MSDMIFHRDDSSTTRPTNATYLRHVVQQSIPMTDFTWKRPKLRGRGSPRKATVSAACAGGKCWKCYSLGCPHDCHGSGGGIPR